MASSSSSKRGATRSTPLWLGAALASVLAACGSGLPETESSAAGADAEGSDAGALRLVSVDSEQVAGGEAARLTVVGEGFEEGVTIERDGVALETEWKSATEVEVSFPARGRGTAHLQARLGQALSNTLEVQVSNTPPQIAELPAQEVDEEQELSLDVPVSDLDGDVPRVFVEGLPPGARFDEAARRLIFRPDFLQGGDAVATVRFTASDGEATAVREVTIEVHDTIHPPDPKVTKTETVGNCKRLTLSQTTDAWLDNANRVFTAVLVVPNAPTAASPAPLRVDLHGAGGTPNAAAGCGSLFTIAPHDSLDTYWWGYGEKLSGSTPVSSGKVLPYTARRVLHLMGYVLAKYPGADPERVFLSGGSMGGAGAKTIGLLWARHFAGVQTTIGQAIPRNHRPSRLKQLSTLWGSPSANLLDDSGTVTWDHMDLTRALRDDPEARDQFVSTKHGKDDPTIHFGAMVMKSALTGLSFYDTLQEHHVGHLAIWDEGAHGPADPVLGSGWWDNGWNRISDTTAFLRRDRPFPAFGNSPLDDDAGDGKGNGKQPWNAESGYAGDLATAGDTGWNGRIAGAHNRYLRWDTTAAVDTRETLELKLSVKSGTGSAPPSSAYPPKGDLFTGDLPVPVDVTPRRVHAFQTLPGEVVLWEFGDVKGEATAAADGSITVAKLPLSTAWKTLKLTRK